MKNWMKGAFVVVVAAAICCVTAHAQTDVAVSGFRTFTSSSSGSGTQQTPHDSEGGLIELRHIVNPLVGYEGTFSFNPWNQSYAPATNACSTASRACGQPPLEVSGKTTQISGDWIVSMKSGNIRPFALGGIGFAFTIPGNSPYTVNSVVRPIFIYGAGLDYGFAPHIGLRLQYRGNVTKAPNLSNLYPLTTKYTTVGEPMAGVFFRF